MSNINYTWTVQSVDDATQTMVVEYVPEAGETVVLNIHKPLTGVVLSDHVTRFAPASVWSPVQGGTFEDVTVGTFGSGVYTPPTASTGGLEALIRSVLASMGIA